MKVKRVGQLDAKQAASNILYFLSPTGEYSKKELSAVKDWVKIDRTKTRQNFLFDIVKIIQEYDEEYGKYPESVFEGESILTWLMANLEVKKYETL